MIKRKNFLAKLKLGEKIVKIPAPAYIFSAANRKKIIVFLVVLILAGLIYFLKGQLIVATVNGQPIWRFTLISELEKQGGKQTLEGLITKTLILQEAKKQKVNVSEEEIGQEIKKIEESLTSQGQDLNQVLGAQGINLDELRQQIRIQKIVEEILGKDIEVTDAEVETYIEENKDFFPEDADTERARGEIKNQLKQQKISEEFEAWIGTLYGKAKISYFRYSQ